MCDLTPMTTYIAELRAMRDEVQATLSSAMATVTPDGEAYPLGRAVADESLNDGASA